MQQVNESVIKSIKSIATPLSLECSVVCIPIIDYFLQPTTILIISFHDY
jgi:hypothetical protein